MAISPSSPPGVQRRHPSKRWWRSKAIAGRSRTVLRPPKTSSGSITTKADPGMDGIATFPGDAHLRHDGGDPPSCQSAAAKKNETPNHGKNKTNAVSSLIRWSIQEVRRIAIRLARKRIQRAHIIAWSLWRRTHQAIAQRAHFKAKRQL